MIKFFIFKNGMRLVAELVEVDVELGEPDCRLVNPFEIDDEGELLIWPKFTDQRTLMIQSDTVLTIVDPNQSILSKYKELVA